MSTDVLAYNCCVSTDVLAYNCCVSTDVLAYNCCVSTDVLAYKEGDSALMHLLVVNGSANTIKTQINAI